MEIEERNTSITIWRIENYSYSWHNKDECLTSPQFGICPRFDSSWRLKLYPRGVTESTDFVGIFLERQSEPSEGPQHLTVDYDISVFNSDGTPKRTILEKDCEFIKGLACGFRRLLHRQDDIEKEKSIVLPEDTLTVRCRITSKTIEPDLPINNFIKTTVLFRRHLLLWDAGKFNYISPSQPGIFKRYPLGYCTLSLRLNFDSVNVLIKIIDENRMFRFRIGILDSSKSTSQFLIDEYLFHPENQSVERFLIQRSKLLSCKDFYLPEGRLILYCEIHFATGIIGGLVDYQTFDKFFTSCMFGQKKNSKEGSSFAPSRCCDNNYDSMKNDFENLYHEGTLGDFSIVVGGETLRVHKAVLCARSPYFKAMLTIGMVEANENKVTISKFQMDTVRRMLTFMYTDKADDLDWETAIKLYSAADYFDMTMLKRICADFLRINLIAANVEDIKILADTHVDGDLRKVALEFLQQG